MLHSIMLAGLPLVAPPAEAPRAAAAPSDASYIDASVRVDGEILDWTFVDIEGDGAQELGLSVRTPRGKRELRFHRMTRSSIEPEPYRTIPILKDIIAWTIADVRPELDGDELVLLTRQGAWSFDPRKSGYKGNIKKLCETQLLYDVPSPRELPYWPYVLEWGEGDALLLPQRGGFRIFGPRPSGEAAASDQGGVGPNPSGDDSALPWKPLATFQGTADRAPIDPEDDKRRAADARRENDRREARFSRTVGGRLRPFMDDGASDNIVDDTFRIQAPALVDLNGDGRRDMLLLDGDRLKVYMASEKGIPSRPTRIEPLPDYLTRDENRAALRLVEINGDGRLDLLGIWSEEADGVKNADWRIFAMLAKPDRLLPEKPDQLLRFKAAEIRATVTDVDGDGRPDLSIRSFELPSLMDTVTGLEFKYSQLLYLGTKRGRFDRRPALKQERTFDEEGVASILANRELSLDCSGDGVADLVEVNLAGELGVRRLRKKSSFLGGDSWTIDDGYWKRYASRGSVASLNVLDLNGDRLGDIVSASESILTIYLSQKR